MICPNCGSDMINLPLYDSNRNKFVIEHCAHCGGFWLNNDNLKKITKEDAEELDTYSENTPEPNPMVMHCPSCYIPMEDYSHPHFLNFKLKKCPDCNNMWLNHGQIFQYINLQKPDVSYDQPDVSGTLSKRDRVMISSTLVSLMLIIGGILLSSRLGNLPLSADFLAQDKTVSTIWLIILGFSILIFIIGLILAFFRKGRTYKIFGWVLVLFSIAVIVLLSQK